MRGHVRKREHKRKDGSTSRLWYAVIYLGTDSTSNKKTYDWGRGYRTQREAMGALNERLQSLATGTYVRSANLSVADYLVDSWLPSVKARVRGNTFTTYLSVVERHLVPMIGTRRLQDLTTMDLTAMYARMATGDVQPHLKHPGRKAKPLAAKSVNNIARVVSVALNDAMDNGLVSRNVAVRAKTPKPVKPQIEAWTAHELLQFLHSTSDQRLHNVWHLASMTGMRRSEFLGLRWDDVSFVGKNASVRQTLVSVAGQTETSAPKNGHARVVDLDPETIAVLRRHQKSQKADKLAFGPGYTMTGYVFTKEDGQPYHPDVVSKAFTRAVAATDLKRITLHGLRHTHATLMIADGVPVKVVSERLGHSSPAFTMAVYQHVMPGMQSDAAAQFATAIRNATKDQDEVGEDSG
ncbi:tyrosine-type recombinase/integrase [Actinospongicola halichondriae]|uniref:tyrosine-type recombinase/integrase n=1 Tax=Actinospongicola halichondriae TaxID=3236844 RepID=UPI003D5B6889